MKRDDSVVAFCNAHNAEAMPLPRDVLVTELLDDGTVIVVPREEFLKWLFEREEV